MLPMESYASIADMDISVGNMDVKPADMENTVLSIRNKIKWVKRKSIKS